MALYINAALGDKEKGMATGLNKNCKYLLLQYAFEELGMERVEFRADNNNSRSVAAMKSIGCTVEGVLFCFSGQQSLIDCLFSGKRILRYHT